MSLLRVTNILPQSGSVVFFSGSTTLSSSFISASVIVCDDGSGISGITAEWDGTHDGDGEITGSFIITETLRLGTSNSHVHDISGSLNLYSGVIKVPITNMLEVYGSIDGIHSSPQVLSRDMKSPDAHNGLLVGPVVTIQVGTLLTIGSGSILTVDP